MIYNIRHRSNDTPESRKEKKTCFNAHAGRKSNLTVQFPVSKQTRWDH